MMTLAPNLFQGHVNNELSAQRVDETKKCRQKCVTHATFVHFCQRRNGGHDNCNLHEKYRLNIAWVQQVNNTSEQLSFSPARTGTSRSFP